MISQYHSRPRDAAAEKIECYIIENGLTAHQKLPSERKMCSMWGLNRTTLAYAIHRLADEGVVYNRVSSGTYVAPPKLERNLQDAQGFGAAAKKAGRTISTRVVSLEIREANKQIAQRMKLPLGHKIMKLVRVRFLEERPVLVEVAFLDAQRLKEIEKHNFSEESLYSVLENDYRIKVVRGEEKLSVTYTDEKESELLKIPEDSPVIYQSGVVSDEDDIPVEYFKSIARSEYIRFASMLV